MSPAGYGNAPAQPEGATSLTRTMQPPGNQTFGALTEMAGSTAAKTLLGQ